MPEKPKPQSPSSRFVLTTGGSESFFNRPFIFPYSIVQNKVTHIQDFRPLRQCMSAASMFYKEIASSIIGLFFERRPSTILPRVITVVVDAFYRSILIPKFRDMLFERLKHVPSKLFKLSPLTFNSPSTIVTPSVVFRIITTPFKGVKGLHKFTSPKSVSIVHDEPAEGHTLSRMWPSPVLS